MSASATATRTPHPLVAVLETDFRELGQLARKGDGGFGGFFASENTELREAAERAVLKVRSFADFPDAQNAVRDTKVSERFQRAAVTDARATCFGCCGRRRFNRRSNRRGACSPWLCFTPFVQLQELLKPLALGCDTKSTRIIALCLSTVQKMLANGAVSQEGVEAVLAMLGRVERSGDEGVQLKSLQTALTLLQSPVHPTSEEALGALLGVCFRMLSHKGHRDAVLQTASATARQAVALVFSYVDVAAELARLDALAASGGAEPGPPPPGVVTASQKLMEDLVSIAAGGPPAWLRAPSLPRTFVLELLDFVLSNSPSLFRGLPAFQSALSGRVCQLVQAGASLGRAWGCAVRSVLAKGRYWLPGAG